MSETSLARWNGRTAVMHVTPEQRTIIRAVLAEVDINVDGFLQKMWEFAMPRGFIDTLEYQGRTTLLGEAVRAGRRKMGWTKTVLGRVLGLSTRIVRDVEQGELPAPSTVTAIAAWLQVPYRYAMRCGKTPWKTGLAVPVWALGGIEALPLDRAVLTYAHIGGKWGKWARNGKAYTVISYGDSVYEYDTKQEAIRKAIEIVEPTVIVHRRWSEAVSLGKDERVEAAWRAWNAKHKVNGVLHQTPLREVEPLEEVTLTEDAPWPEDDYMPVREWQDAGEADGRSTEAEDIYAATEEMHTNRSEKPEYMSRVQREEEKAGALMLPNDETDTLPDPKDIAAGIWKDPPPGTSEYAKQFWKKPSDAVRAEMDDWLRSTFSDDEDDG